MDQATTTAIQQQQSPNNSTKQGFRFHKSGNISPIPPSSQGPQKLSRSNSNNSGDNISPGSGEGRTQQKQLQLPSNIDHKLYQIIKRITSNTPSLLVTSSAKATTRKSNTNAITSLILEKHREYQRKEINTLKSSVDKILILLGGASNTNNSSGSTSREGNREGSSGGKEGNREGGGGKKRRASIPIGGGSNNISTSSATANDSNDTTKKKQRLILEEDPNQEDIIQEQIQQQLVRSNQGGNSNSTSSGVSGGGGGGGGMLNASLRNRYKDVQREREEIEASEKNKNEQSVIDEEGNDEGEGKGEKGGKEDGKEGKETAAVSDGNVSSGSPSTAATAATASSQTTTSSSTPKKKKKTKKTPSSKSSSNNPNNFQLQQQDGNNPFTTSSTILLQPTPRPTERYSNLGGISSLLQQLRELIEYPLSHPELFIHLGVEPPRGVLLRGPPGCGKTHLAKAIAGELNVNYFQVSAPELVGGVSGESEARVRTLFESASNYAPAIIFIDEIDAIAPKRGSSDNGGGKSMEKRIVAQLLTSMDTLHPKSNRNSSAVMVLGATNRPDAMDSALRRAGRFDREIVLGAPDEKAREGILRVMTKEMKVDDNDLNYKLLAKKTPGFVGADVRSLTKEAAVIAINRIFCMDLLSGSGDGDEKKDETGGIDDKEDVARASGEDAKNESSSNSNNNDIQSITPLTPTQLQPLYVTMQDFLSAIPNVQPSAKREGFATVPDVAWSDIGALANIREELTLSVLEPISHPERFEALGLPLPAGVLLYGPPGCGKTLLAKAIANESGANFISVKGPELLDKYVGESERAVRVVFERARSSSPCIIFFDELDSLCPKRGSDSGGGGGVSERVVNQLLTEMDGLDSRRSVFVIAATNRPELIDPAMLRPGRLDKLLYVSLPSPDDRHSILCALSKTVKLGPDVDLHAIAHNPHASGFSGADCAALLREAGLAVLRDGVLSRTKKSSTAASDTSINDDDDDKKKDEAAPLQITAHHFQYAFEHVLPSVSKKDQARYDKLRSRMARARTRGGAPSESTGKGDASDIEGSAALPSGDNDNE